MRISWWTFILIIMSPIYFGSLRRRAAKKKVLFSACTSQWFDYTHTTSNSSQQIKYKNNLFRSSLVPLVLRTTILVPWTGIYFIEIYRCIHSHLLFVGTVKQNAHVCGIVKGGRDKESEKERERIGDSKRNINNCSRSDYTESNCRCVRRSAREVPFLPFIIPTRLT